MPEIEPFETHVPLYEAWFTKDQVAYESELRAVRSLMPAGGRRVEVSVGTGRFAIPLGIAFGVEPSPAMAQVARVRNQGRPRCSRSAPVRRGDFRRSPLRDDNLLRGRPQESHSGGPSGPPAGWDARRGPRGAGEPSLPSVSSESGEGPLLPGGDVLLNRRTRAYLGKCRLPRAHLSPSNLSLARERRDCRADSSRIRERFVRGRSGNQSLPGNTRGVRLSRRSGSARPSRSVLSRASHVSTCRTPLGGVADKESTPVVSTKS